MALFKGAPVSLKTFSRETIFHYADSPLSRQTPANWADVMKKFPGLVKKVIELLIIRSREYYYLKGILKILFSSQLPITDWVDSKSMYNWRPVEEVAAVITNIPTDDTGMIFRNTDEVTFLLNSH